MPYADFEPNQEILFTRQRHEAEKMGLHFDYRLVLGDKAYSWATKKEMPEPGKSIVLFEQPVHDRDYALSQEVHIPTGQYGAGVTKLEFARKAKIGEHATKTKFTIESGGDRFLLKHIPDSQWGDKAWLFRNLGPKSKLQKKASLIAGALGTHLIQNFATSQALKSKRVAKYLADSFAQGAHGVVDTSLGAKAKRVALSATVPDIAVAHKTVHDAGRSMKDLLAKATPQQKVGLRMLSQGRFSDLVKHELHKDPVVEAGHALMSQHMKLPALEHMAASSSKVEKVWNSPEHPLLSNIAKNISKGEKPLGDHFAEGKLSSKPLLGGAAASFAIDPAAGALNTAKALTSSSKMAENKYGKKAIEMLHNQFIKKPIQHGAEAPGAIGGLKNKFYQYAVNPMSANLAKTTSSLADAL
jgi:hypothetical protein